MQGKLLICFIAAVLLLTGCSAGTGNSQNGDQKSDKILVENKYYQLGIKLKDNFSLENNRVYLALVNGEPIRLSEWNYMVYYMEGKKNQEEIFKDFVILKTQVAAAKEKGLMPSAQDLSQIRENTQKPLTDKKASLFMLLQGAELTSDEYCEIMKPQGIDKLAVSNWQTYVNDYLNNNENIDLDTMDQEDYSNAFYSMAIDQIGNSEINITEEGIQAGMDNSWITITGE